MRRPSLAISPALDLEAIFDCEEIWESYPNTVLMDDKKNLFLAYRVEHGSSRDDTVFEKITPASVKEVLAWYAFTHEFSDGGSGSIVEVIKLALPMLMPSPLAVANPSN